MPSAVSSKPILRAGTCPHGLPIGSCPICNGMGSGGMKKADFSAKPGEMSWNECAAIGQMLKARRNAKLAREQDVQTSLQNSALFTKLMNNVQKNIIAFNSFINSKLPRIISSPILFFSKTLLLNSINFIKDFPANIRGIIQTVSEKFTEISDKLTAIYGELKTAIEKKLAEPIKIFGKKLKSKFSIFGSKKVSSEEPALEEPKRTTKLKTFLHELYKKITTTSNRKK